MACLRCVRQDDSSPLGATASWIPGWRCSDLSSDAIVKASAQTGSQERTHVCLLRGLPEVGCNPLELANYAGYTVVVKEPLL